MVKVYMLKANLVNWLLSFLRHNEFADFASFKLQSSSSPVPQIDSLNKRKQHQLIKHQLKTFFN